MKMGFAFTSFMIIGTERSDILQNDGAWITSRFPSICMHTEISERRNLSWTFS